jgi:hypothetical protein
MELKTLLAGRPRDAKVEWEGEVVGITFDPTKYTPELEAKLMARADEPNGTQAIIPFIQQLVVGWDITENGVPFPMTDDAVASLPLGFLVAVIRSVAGELAADPTLLGTSEGPS